MNRVPFHQHAAAVARRIAAEHGFDVLEVPRTGRRPGVRTGAYMAGQPSGAGCGVGPSPAGCPAPGCDAATYQNKTYAGWAGPQSPGCTQKVLSGSELAVALSTASSLEISSLTQFCPQRLVVITSGTDGFSLDAFFIGNNPQFIRGNSVHSAVYAPDAVQVGLSGDCLTAGQTARFEYTNLDGAATQDIYLAMIGTSQG